jgi:hypothetical protein
MGTGVPAGPTRRDGRDRPPGPLRPDRIAQCQSHHAASAGHARRTGDGHGPDLPVHGHLHGAALFHDGAVPAGLSVQPAGDRLRLLGSLRRHPVGTQIGGRLAARVGVRPLLLLGLAVGAIGAALVASNVTPGCNYSHLVPGLLIFGLGQGTAWTPMWIAPSAGIAEAEQSVASGMASTTLWIGGATGLAILVVLAGLPANGGITVPTVALVFSIRTAIFAIAAGIAASGLVAFFTSRVAIGETNVMPL